jgi:hypothetical protein
MIPNPFAPPVIPLEVRRRLFPDYMRSPIAKQIIAEHRERNQLAKRFLSPAVPHLDLEIRKTLV